MTTIEHLVLSRFDGAVCAYDHREIEVTGRIQAGEIVQLVIDGGSPIRAEITQVSEQPVLGGPPLYIGPAQTVYAREIT